MDGNLMTKEEIREFLTSVVADVKFTKTDGTIRNMRCTLRPDHLPAPSVAESVLPKTKREENPNIIAVWDIDKKDWRSFRVDSIIDMFEHY
jgi:hypothetical protein